MFLLSLPTSKVTSSVQITRSQFSSFQSLCAIHYLTLSFFWMSFMKGFVLAFLQFDLFFFRIFHTASLLICLPPVLIGVLSAMIESWVSLAAAQVKDLSPLAETFEGCPSHFLLAKELRFSLYRSKMDCTVLLKTFSSLEIFESDRLALRQVTIAERFAIECSFLVTVIFIYIFLSDTNSVYSCFPLLHVAYAWKRGCTNTLLTPLYINRGAR
jgi:hypothetical protein